MSAIEAIAQAIRDPRFYADDVEHEQAARFLVAELEAAGYAVKPKPKPRASKVAAPAAEPFAPNTGDPVVDAFMRRKHDPKHKLVKMPTAPGLPPLRTMKVSEQDAAEAAWERECEAARRAIDEGEKPAAQVELERLIRLHRPQWRKVATKTDGPDRVTTYASPRHPGVVIEQRERFAAATVYVVVREGVAGPTGHADLRLAEAEADSLVATA